MEAQAQQLRSAIAVLYNSPNRSDQHRADTWLQEFRAAPEAWGLCLDLLSSNPALDHEAYFAANTLRYCCSKVNQLTAPEVVAQLLPKLVLCLFDSLSKSKWPVVSQLSTAIAVLILRSPSWSAQNIIADLERVVLSQYPVFQRAAGAQQDAQQPTIAHAAMLQILAALPPACADKQCSVHPNRRLAVSEALAASGQIQPWVQTAFMAVEQPLPAQAQQLYLNLGLQLIHGWCELGNLPITLPQQVSIVQRVCMAALRSETSMSGSEAMVSMLNITKDVAMQGSDVLLLLVQTWQEALSTLPAETPPEGILQAVCSVLCAAAAALLPFSLGSDNVLKVQFLQIAEQLLRQLTSTDDDVALTALEFWQDTYLTSLQGLPSSGRQAAITSHNHLLQLLTQGLVLRTRLDGDAVQTATADARDLPEEVRMVRRELASALRDITSLVGVGSMSQYMASIVQNAWGALSQQLRNSTNPPNSPQSPPSPAALQSPAATQAWTALECTLYAANVVLGQSRAGKRREPASSQAVQALVEVCVACLVQAQETPLHPKLLGTALTLLGGLSSWYQEHPEALRSVLSTLSLTLKASNDKLARNAATTVYRLCQHSALATQILVSHQAWVEGLLQLYSISGGVQRRIGQGDDLPTEELLLASLCRLAMQPASNNLPFGSTLLVHLTDPKLQELRQALQGLVACAPMALQMLAGTSTNTYTPAEQQQQQQQVMQLDAASQTEFARATAYAAQAGVCLDVLHMVAENATTSGPKVQDVLGMQSSATSLTDSPRCSVNHEREYGGGGYSILNTAGSMSDRGDSEMSRNSSFTSSAPASTSMQGEQASACNEQVLALIQAVWGILQPCLPQLQALHAVMGPACVLFTCAVRNLPPLMRPDIMTVSAQLLGRLPPRVLVLPKALALLTTCLNNLSNSERGPGAAGDPGLRQDSMASRFLGVTQAAIIHSCGQAVVTCDPDLAIPTLNLCCTVLTTLPGVLTLASTLDAMLTMTRATGKTYDVEQCKQWLEWVQLFLSAPYCSTSGSTSTAGGLRPQPQVKLALGAGGAGIGTISEVQPASQLPAAQCEGLAALAGMLQAGAGPQLLLCILMAGSGDMPPDLVQLLAVTMHQIWHAIGTQRFSSWLEVAVLELAPESAPWYKQKQDSKVASLQELVCADTEYDVGRFKKLFKQLCGGKKKMVALRSLPGSRSVSRSPSTLSSMQMSA